MIVITKSELSHSPVSGICLTLKDLYTLLFADRDLPLLGQFILGSNHSQKGCGEACWHGYRPVHLFHMISLTRANKTIKSHIKQVSIAPLRIRMIAHLRSTSTNEVYGALGSLETVVFLQANTWHGAFYWTSVLPLSMPALLIMRTTVFQEI